MSDNFEFKSDNEIENYVSNIINTRKTQVDPFIDEMSGRLLKIIIMYVLENEPIENHNISRCIEIVTENRNKSAEECELTKKIKALSFGNKIYMEYETIKITPDLIFREIFENLSSKLGI